jgi:uncharacterized membrane protein YkvA (DUF1232 family)
VAAPAARVADWARSIKRDVRAVYLASRDPRTPWYAKAVAIGVAAYALSPIDLIPDFIPILGQLDELIVLPLGIWLVVRLIPPEVMNEHRAAAAILDQQGPRSIAGAVTIIIIWIGLTVGSGWLAYCWLWP